MPKKELTIEVLEQKKIELKAQIEQLKKIINALCPYYVRQQML